MAVGSCTRTPVTVTARAMTILSVFSKEHPVMGLQEIGWRTGLTRSTTHRLVHELVEWGALSRVDARAYRIGPLIRRLAASSLASQEKVGASR